MIPRYSRPEMRSIWTDENKLDLWLQIEMLAAEALVKEGIVPAADFKRMRAGANKCFANLPGLVARQMRVHIRFLMNGIKWYVIGVGVGS